MLNITKNYFSDLFRDSGIIKKDDESYNTCYFSFSDSGRFILIHKDDSFYSNSYSLMVFDTINNQLTSRYFNSPIKSMRNIHFVGFLEEYTYNVCEYSLFDFADIVLIENSDFGIDMYNISNGDILLNNFLLENKLIVDTSGFFSNGTIIVSILTEEGIYLFSNNKYELFEDILKVEEYGRTTGRQIKKNMLIYYRLIVPGLVGNLSSCCVSRFGRLYFSTKNEIFRLGLPFSKESMDFQIEKVFNIEMYEDGVCLNNDLVNITNLVCYETMINDKLFELMYIIFEDEDTTHHKNLSLLQINIDKEYDDKFQYFFISELNKKKSCTHVLAYKVFTGGQIGIIWESENQIYINIFNHFFNNSQHKSLNYSECLNEKSFNKSDSFRDFTSLLYGDAPLIYISDTEFDSSSQKTDEILKIHGKVFSNYLCIKDIEKEEFYIEEILQSVISNKKYKRNISVGGSCNMSQHTANQDTNMKNPLINMERFIFVSSPVLYSPINGIKNDNITNLPNDWYSNMTFSVSALVGNKLEDFCLLDINYICWYQGLYEYLICNLGSILKTPQMHLPILKRLTLLNSNYNYSKPSSIWTSLNSLKNIEDSKKMSDKDLELLYSVIELYVKNGIHLELIKFSDISASFIYALYSWSIYQFDKIYNYFNQLADKVELMLSPNEFSMNKQNNTLNLVIKLSILTDQKLLVLFLSSNLTPLKSVLSILYFLFTDICRRQEDEMVISVIVDFFCLIKSLLDWNTFQQIFFPLISKHEVEHSDGDETDADNDLKDQISTISIDCINDLKIFKEFPVKGKRGEQIDWSVMITLAFLLETFVKNHKKISESVKNGTTSSLIQDEINVVYSIDKFINERYNIMSYYYLFRKTISFPAKYSFVE